MCNVKGGYSDIRRTREEPRKWSFQPHLLLRFHLYDRFMSITLNQLGDELLQKDLLDSQLKLTLCLHQLWSSWLPSCVISWWIYCNRCKCSTTLELSDSFWYLIFVLWEHVFNTSIVGRSTCRLPVHYASCQPWFTRMEEALITNRDYRARLSILWATWVVMAT